MASHIANLKLPASRVASPAALLRLEGLAVLVTAIMLYADLKGSGLLFILLLLAPDLAMIGYLSGQQTGAMVYNIVHFYGLPLAVAAIGLAAGSPLVLQVALVWLAHIGMDRLFGYGLKYPTAFKDTHLSRL